MGKLYSPLNFGALEVFARYREMQIDLGKYLGLNFSPFGNQLDVTSANCLFGTL